MRARWAILFKRGLKENRSDRRFAVSGAVHVYCPERKVVRWTFLFKRSLKENCSDRRFAVSGAVHMYCPERKVVRWTILFKLISKGRIPHVLTHGHCQINLLLRLCVF